MNAVNVTIRRAVSSIDVRRYQIHAGQLLVQLIAQSTDPGGCLFVRRLAAHRRGVQSRAYNATLLASPGSRVV